MREIKFRAFVKPDNKVQSYSGMYPVVELCTESKKVVVYRASLFAQCVFPYDDVEIMQYIGLNDCQGVKIFEGDIVEFDANEWGSPDVFDRRWAVKWDDREGAWDTGGGENEECGDWKTVIGNIYQHPELLE